MAEDRAASAPDAPDNMETQNMNMVKPSPKRLRDDEEELTVSESRSARDAWPLESQQCTTLSQPHTSLPQAAGGRHGTRPGSCHSQDIRGSWRPASSYIDTIFKGASLKTEIFRREQTGVFLLCLPQGSRETKTGVHPRKTLPAVARERSGVSSGPKESSPVKNPLTTPSPLHRSYQALANNAILIPDTDAQLVQRVHLELTSLAPCSTLRTRSTSTRTKERDRRRSPTACRKGHCHKTKYAEERHSQALHLPSRGNGWQTSWLCTRPSTHCCACGNPPKPSSPPTWGSGRTPNHWKLLCSILSDRC